MKKYVSHFLPIVFSALGLGLSADAADTIYVSNAGENTIALINQGAGTTTTFGSSQFLSTPEGLAFDNKGNLFIANYGTSLNGGFIEQYNLATQSFTTFATGLANPTGLAFDSQGDLYVANYIGGSITKYNAGSNIGTTFASGLVTPNGIAIDKFGDLYVTQGTGLNQISRIDPSGNVSSFNTSGTGLSKPIGATFGADGNLYVVNNGNKTIENIALNLQGSTYISNDPAHPFTNPIDLAFDNAGNLYVTDYNDKVTEYNSKGQLINTYITGIQGPTFLVVQSGSLSVPEPGTYALLLVGLAGLYYFRQRRAAVTVKA